MYKLVKNKDTQEFEILEEQTNQILCSFKEHKEAHPIYRRFNGGRGFCGWTPEFMFYGNWKFKG